ncbi:MAG: peptidoglycan-binding protein [bacterium]|nr:peptidoglycan-binding protein [bacterium]
MLSAFGVDAGTITNVNTILSGGTVSTESTTPVSTSANAITATMIGQLGLGATGNSVCYLQTLLAADPAVYPEGRVTCYFGPLTAAAVRKFQGKHGIERVGFIGPRTLAAIAGDLKVNPLAVEDADDTDDSDGHQGKGRLCAKVPPGHLVAPGWLRKHGGVVPLVPTCQTLPPGIALRVGGGTGTTTTTLSITGLAASGITSTGATIGWMTSVGASSQVNYGTTTSYGDSSALDSNLVTSHSVVLSGLAPSTTYHFQAVSAATSTTAASSDMTFTTLATPDTTPPIISAVAAGSIATTTATIMWTTDEAATSKVYYATTTPIDFTSAAMVSNASFVTAHSLNLSGLTASTTYSYAVVSADISGNTATSSTSSFLTTN